MPSPCHNAQVATVRSAVVFQRQCRHTITSDALMKRAFSGCLLAKAKLSLKHETATGENGLNWRPLASFSSCSFKHGKKSFYALDPEQAMIEKENARWRNRAKRELETENRDKDLPPALYVECRRGKGQHLLTNDHIVEVIAKRAGIQETDTVLEIGPGTGNLTLRLLEVASKVIAIEIDPRMIEELQRRVQHAGHEDKLTLIHGDIMEMDFPDFDICVANIPYKISSPLTFKLLGCGSNFRAAVLMLQREFARRLMAAPGDPLFCRLSLNSQLLAKMNVLMEVSKANFSPPPKVDSSVVCISPHPWPPPVNLKEWNNFVRICFNRKNKTLGAIFRQKHVLYKLATSNSLLPGVQESSKGSHDLDKAYGELAEGEGSTMDSHDVDHTYGELTEEESATSEDEDSEEWEVTEEDLSHLKEKVIATLRLGGYEDKRSAKLKQDNFMALLESFHMAGVKFS